MIIQVLQTLATDLDEQFVNKVRSEPNKVFFPNFGSGDNIFSEGINIDRVLFTIPGINFKIYWYGFLIAIGITLAMFYGFRRMRTVGIDPDRATDAVIAGFFGAIVGARLYYVTFNADYSFSRILDVRSGGLALYGGIIGAILVGGIVVKVRKLKLMAILDCVAPCFLIGISVGRWGNFFNQEAFGANTDLPWGMMSSKTINYIAEHYDDLGGTVSSYAPVHPCFLYESLWCLGAFLILHFYMKHRKFDGEVFLMFVGLYGLGRFFIESTRTDSLYIMNIKVSQLIAGTSVLASLVLIIVFRNIVKRNDEYKLYVDTELSKAQLQAYDSYETLKKEKKELKAKIREAKANGESVIELEKEFDEKFGKNAKKPSDDVKEVNTAAENYKPILADDDSEEDSSETTENSAEEDQSTNNNEDENKEDNNNG